MKVVILCGGTGIRLHDQTSFIPKGLVMIDDKPLLWHVMKRYSLFGYSDFILALGQYGDAIRNYFFNYDLYTTDVKLTIGKSSQLRQLSTSQEADWNMTFVNTGAQAHTGARLNRLRRYLKDEEEFMLAYSDCLSDVNLDKLIRHHRKNKKIATITGVMPPYRYGEFILKDGEVVNYQAISKLIAAEGSVNGGFMVLNKKIFDSLTSYNECTLEDEVFKKLVKKHQLSVYKHTGFWQCLDNDREYAHIKSLCDNNKRYWLRK